VIYIIIETGIITIIFYPYCRAIVRDDIVIKYIINLARVFKENTISVVIIDCIIKYRVTTGLGIDIQTMLIV